VEAKGSVSPFIGATILPVRTEHHIRSNRPTLAVPVTNTPTATGSGRTMFDLHTV
jgi:hypothetical protein